MNEKRIQELFMQGYDCSQVVLAHYAEQLGISEEMANKVSACFGGGMLQAGTCGAFTGALMNGNDVFASAKIAADYTVKCIINTQGDDSHWYGAKFETALRDLIDMI